MEWNWYNQTSGSQLILSGNTTGLSNGTNSLITTLGSGNTTTGETWNCTIRAFDGDDYSSYLSATVNIPNSAPIVTNIQAIPYRVANGTTLNISANITDPGGVSAAFVNIYFPNGAFWTNITLLNSSNPDIWFNDSIIVPSSGSWGNYTFTIWAKDSYNAVNNTEGSSFVVYVDFNEKATDIIIDGNFNERSSGKISESVQDSSTASESGTQNFKLRSNNGTVKIENASSGGHIIQTSTGILYAFILDPSVCEIWKSTDEGNTWSQQDSSNSPTTSTSCTIAIDSNDTLHLLYNQSNSVKYNTFSTLNNTFGPSPTTIESSVTSILTFAISVDSNDKVHIVYDDNSLGGTSYLKYNNNVDGSWLGTSVNIDNTTSGDGFGFGSITISEDDIPEIAYIDRTNGDLTAAVGDDNDPDTAGQWTLYDVDTNTNFALDIATASISIDSSGNTWIAYVDEDGANDYLNIIKHNDGDIWTTWQTPIETTDVASKPL